MTLARGRAPKSQRCIGRTPYDHWHTNTFVCALRQTGLTAPCVLDGPINGSSFLAWVQQMLAPQLFTGDIVVMDNLGSHKVPGVQQAIQASGAPRRYLPPYSPDFNPIEQVFAKLKASLRRSAARTRESLCSAIGTLLDAGEGVKSGEMVVFANDGAPVVLSARGDEDAVFVLGSAMPHPHELHLGHYSVHTSAKALAAGEQRLAQLGQQMRSAGDRATPSGTVPVYR